MYDESSPRDPKTQSVEIEFRPVGDIVKDVKQALETSFSRVYVSGEISNFKRHASGHCYFVLKDDDAQLRAVIWRSTANKLQVLPRDGLQVEIRGRVTVYPSRGELQLSVDNLRPAGEGAAQRALQELKQKLQREGLFSRAHKKTLPRFPERIGVITSGSGAALQDILRVVGRRFPVATVYVMSVRVQGVGAPESIAEAIGLFGDVGTTEPHRCDVLIVGRGGGSVEDLWAFNEEIVARAIFDCPIPIVSAVGHESDISISDFVADVRAATPSHAAEIIVPDRYDVAAALIDARRSLDRSINMQIQESRQRIDYLLTSYYFKRTLDQVLQLQTRARDLEKRLSDAARRLIVERGILVTGLYRRLFGQRTEERIELLKASTADLLRRLHRAFGIQSSQNRTKIESLQKQLLLVDPERPLRTGWALVTKDDSVVTTIENIEPGEMVRVRFVDGEAEATIDSKTAALDDSDPET
ncbi:MAG: exodeoxyribonuclease VII large subunit [Rhodothermales bacterium]|nr:exodeoxyribonuclease VII large subunit [Rhodothermales bacterium]